MLRLSSQWTVLFFVLLWVEIGQKFNEKAGEKLSKKIGWKTRENAGDLYYSAVDNFDFTRKIVKNILGEKLVKMLGICQNWIFGQKLDFSNSVKN